MGRSGIILCLVVLSTVSLEGVAQESDDAAASLGGFPLEGFPGIGESPRVVLVDPGEGEKTELRYRLSAGSAHEMVMTMTMTMQMSNPQGTSTMQMPGMQFVDVP